MLINKRKYVINNNKKILHKIGRSWVVISTILLLALAGGTTVHANNINQNIAQPQENSTATIPVQNQSQSTHANSQPTNNESQISINSISSFQSPSLHSSMLSPAILNHPSSDTNNSQVQPANFSAKSTNNNQIASTSTNASVSASMSESASAHSAFISSSVAKYNSYVASAKSSESRASSASMSASESDKARQANSQSNYAYSVINNPSFINSSLASSASHNSFISNSVAKYRSYEASVNASKDSASQSYSASVSASKASYNSYVASIQASLFSSESASQSESQSIMNSIEYIDTHAEISSYVAPPQRYVIHSNSPNSRVNHITSESNSEAKLSGKTNMPNIQPNSQANKANNKTNNKSAVNSNHEKERNSNSEASQQSASFRPIAYNHQPSGSNSLTQPVKNKASLSISVTNQASSNVVVSNSHQSINPIIRMPGSIIQTNVSDEPIEYSTTSQINTTIQPKLKTSSAMYQRLNEQSTSSLAGTLNGLHSSQKLLHLKTKSNGQLSTKSLAELNNVFATKLNTKAKVKKNKEVNRHRPEKLPQTNEVKSYQLLALIMLISAMVINATGYVFIKHHE